MITDDRDHTERLRAICVTLNWELEPQEGTQERWIARRASGAEVEINREDRRLLLASEMSIPDVAPPLPSGQGDDRTLEAMLVQTGSSVDPMLTVRIDADRKIARAEFPVYLDGLSTQELARAEAALSRAVEVMKDAAGAYEVWIAQEGDLEETLAEFERDAEGLRELMDDVDAMNRKLSTIPEIDEAEGGEGETEEVDSEAEEAIRTCGACRRSVPDGKRFCPACGAAMEE